MRFGLSRLIRPWTWSWSWRGWLALVFLALAGAWGGRQAYAWQQRRAAADALERYHPAEALVHVTACLCIWPNDPQALLLASGAARRLGDFAAAERHLQALEKAAPHDKNALDLEWSLVRATAGAIDHKVEDFLIPLAAREPALAPAIWEALIEGYVRVYRIRDAFIFVERWLELQPDNVQALYQRGMINRHIKRLARAVPDLQKVVELDPARDDARKWLAAGLIESGYYAPAVDHLRELRRRTPGDDAVVIYLARAYKDLGQTQSARDLLDELLAGQARHALALRVRGEVEMAHDPVQAEAWFRKSIDAFPFDYQAQFLLSQALSRQDKPSEAQAQRIAADALKDRAERLGDLMSRRMSIHPHDPALHVEMGTLLISLGEKEVGHGWLLSALQKDPAFRPAHAALADYYEDTGAVEQAALHRRQAGP
ncbi:MAG: tetratricopeptide repeat protein [Gemmataceae bacterium]|nr:tetratricopeptide repeat protein [Gemmataceae bacterium]